MAFCYKSMRVFYGTLVRDPLFSGPVVMTSGIFFVFCPCSLKSMVWFAIPDNPEPLRNHGPTNP